MGRRTRFVEYCGQVLSVAAAAETEIAVRTKLPLPRVEAIVRALVNEKRLIPLGPKLYIHAITAAHRLPTNLRTG